MPKMKNKSRARRKAPAKKSKGFLAIIGDRISNAAVAGIAGVSVVSVLIAIVLWAGGYFGLAGEYAGRIARQAAVSAGFDIHRVTALGLDETSEGDLTGAVGPVIGTSIGHFDIHGARVRVENLGWVRSAAVTRLWPNTIHVSIREREPAAVWQMSGELHLIDPEGAVIREVSAYEYSNLPLIVGAGAPESVSDLLVAVRRESALWAETAALVRVGERRWNLRLNSGTDVKFPEDGIDDAVRTLARLQDAYGLLDRPLEYVDLRDPSRLVYRELDNGEPAADEKIVR